ncbi:MAG: Fur family transcriptional regulator [Calditrichota bacterium]|jgi:Fur family transcriptional regulator, ferric uptake regulator
MLDFKTALSKLRTYLRDNNLRFTTERVIILEEIFSSPSHFDAEQLFIQIRNKHQHISRATVYRTLDLLSQIGIIKKENLGQGYASYELDLNVPHHDHMICVECGKVVEFVDDVIEKRQKEISEKYGMDMIRHQLQIYGRCKEHRKK